MVDDLIENLIEPEIQRVPENLRRFLFKEQPPSSGEQTLAYYTRGYSAAFECVARQAIDTWPMREYLRLPLVYLCRHSIELALKEAIEKYSNATYADARMRGHNLVVLWDEMIRLVKTAGFSADDEWTAYCQKLINHLHETDPDGERFRYPFSITQANFEFTRVEFEGLIKAQWHIITYCEAVITMRDESNPY